MITKNQSNLILKGIKLHKESQRDLNKRKYTSANRKRVQANKILDGFPENVVIAHFKLFKNK